MKKLLLYSILFLFSTFLAQGQSKSAARNTSCLHGPGYWKNHSACQTKGKATKRDNTWDLIQGYDENGNESFGEQTIFFKSKQDYCEVFDTNPGKGGKYYILAHKYITAQLNILATPNTVDTDNIFGESTTFLNTYTPEDIRNSKALQGESVKLSSELASFSNRLNCDDIENPIIGVLADPIDIKQNSMTLNWTAASDNVGVTSYRIYKDGVLDQEVGNVLTYNVTGLNAATLYSFYITALDEAGNESEQSNTVQGLTIDSDPPVIGVLADPVNITQNSLTLNWTAASDNVGVTSYRIYKDGVLDQEVGNVLTYKVTGLNAATLYSFYITALDEAGNKSEQSNTVQGLTIDTNPPVIGILAAPVNIKQNSLTLNWTAASDNVGVTNYYIYKDGALEQQVGNVLTYEVTGLDPDTVYNFYITALDAEGNESNTSNAVQGLTLSVPTGNTITMTSNSVSSKWQLVNVTNSGALLEWEATDGITAINATGNTPELNLSVFGGNPIDITITSSDNFVGLTQLDLWNGESGIGAVVTNLNVDNAVALEYLNTRYSPLTGLDVNNNAALTVLILRGRSQLADQALITTNNPQLTYLQIDGTGINAVDLSSNELLLDVRLYDARLTSPVLDQVLIDLDNHGLSGGNLQIANQGSGQSITSASSSAYTSLIGKGWAIDVAAPIGDTEPPVIGVLSNPVDIAQTTMTLNWTAATDDNVGVTNYNIYKDGVLEQQVGNVLTYDVTGLNPATTYDFYITALDNEGNESSTSNTVQGLTLSVPTGNSITMTSNSVSSKWQLVNVTNSGALLEWEATDGITAINATGNTPELNLSVFGGNPIDITITSSDNFVGLTQLDLWNGESGIGAVVTNLNVDNAVALEYLNTRYSPLTGLDVNNNAALTVLILRGRSQLADQALITTNNPQLTYLQIDGTGINAVDLSSNKLLLDVRLYDARLTSPVLDQVLIDLDNHGLSGGNLQIANQGSGQSITSASSVAYASLIDKGWIIDVDAPLANKIATSKIDIYPNPVYDAGAVSFKSTSSGFAEVQLYGSSGQAIGTLFYGETLKDQDYTLEYDLNQLEQGMYFAVFKIGNEIISRKILITK